MDLCKILVLSTTALALLGLVVMKNVSLRPKVAIEISNPIFGDRTAPIEMILFEDLKCHNCRVFSEEVLPRIESDYLREGRIRLNVVPLGLLSGSNILANAALEVYQLFPEGFFSYVKGVFARFSNESIEDPTNEMLLELAKESGVLDLAALKACIEEGCHYAALDSNLAAAKALMGKNLHVPAVYVNGVLVNSISYLEIQQQIERAVKGS